MNRIEISPNDKKDLLELLDYAQKKKKEDDERKDKRDHWHDSEYWRIRIDQLKMIVNGYVTQPHIQSSMRTMQTPLSQKEKAHLRYQQSIESELDDLMDYFEKKRGEELY